MNEIYYKELSAQTSPWFHFMVGTVLLLTTTLSATINGSLLYLFFIKDHKLLNRTNIHICFVCVIAFLMTGTAIPMVIISSFGKQWAFGNTGCVYYGFIMTFCGTATIFILTMFAVDRYILVEFYCLDGKSLKHFSTLSIIGSCLMSLILAVCPLIGWNQYSYDGVGTACGPDLTGGNTYARAYLITLIIMAFVFPVVVMIFCFTRIFIKVKEMVSVRDEHSEVSGINQKYQLERDLAITSIRVIGLFLLMWTPYAIVMMWYIVTNGAYIHPLLASIPSMVTKTSSCFIPLVYLGRSKHIRKAVLDMYPWFRSTNIQNGAISEHVEDLNLNGVVLSSKNKTTTHMATTKT